MTNSATIPRQDFLDMLRFVGGAISRTTTLPVLAHVWIGSEEGKLCLRTTNLDFHLRHHSEISWPFEAMSVNHQRLSQFISAAQSPELLIQVGKTVRCICGDSEAEFNALEAAELPSWPSAGKVSEVWAGQAGELSEALNAVVDCASNEESRYVLNGVCFDGENNVVATNGRVLALARLGNLSKLTIPTAAVRIMASVSDGDATLTASESESQAFLDAGAKSVAAKLIDGKFPDYKKVIPSEYKFRIVLPREELLDKVKLCELATTEKCSSIKLVFTKKNLRLSGGDPSISKSQSDIATNGDFEFSIAMAPRYLVRALSKIKSDGVVMAMIDELSPLALRPEGDEQAQLHIVMPMRMR